MSPPPPVLALEHHSPGHLSFLPIAAIQHRRRRLLFLFRLLSRKTRNSCTHNVFRTNRACNPGCSATQ